MSNGSKSVAFHGNGSDYTHPQDPVKTLYGLLCTLLVSGTHRSSASLWSLCTAFPNTAGHLFPRLATTVTACTVAFRFWVSPPYVSASRCPCVLVVGLDFDFNSGTVESQKNLRVVFLECWLDTQHGWGLIR